MNMVLALECWGLTTGHIFTAPSRNEISGKKNQKVTTSQTQKLNDIFDDASLELDFSKRKQLYDEYQQLVYDEKPIIYLYSPIRISAVRNKFDNIYPTELGGVLHNIEEIYLK